MYNIYIDNIIIVYEGRAFVYISYDYYRIFYYVAKYGSISHAAKLLLNN